MIDAAAASLLELADLHLATLYDVDRMGRIVPRAAVPAPRAHLVRTTAGNRWLIGAHVARAEAAELAALLSAERPLPPSWAGAEPTPPALELALAAREPLRNRYRGPAFLAQSAPPDVGEAEIVADPTGDERFQGALAWVRTSLEEERPIAARFERGRAVAVCHSARRSLEAAEAGVETVPQARGRGHATAVTAAWIAATQRAGRLAMYSTTWDNAASRRVAAKLGLRLYAEDWHID